MLIGMAVCILSILLYYPARFAWYRIFTAYMRAKGDYYEESVFRMMKQNAELAKKCAEQDDLSIQQLEEQVDLLEEKVRLLEKENTLLKRAQK